MPIFSAHSRDRPLIVLAPMAGVTDAPMRSLVAEFGADAVVSEMLASHEWKANRNYVKNKTIRGDIDENIAYVTQIAGRDPEIMREVAIWLEAEGVDQIDINMGCPSKKVNSGLTAGAALLCEPMLALNIVESVANAVSIPVSVKTRLGWEAKDSFLLTKQFVNAGAKAISIHGRTRAQKYTGEADWKAVSHHKNSLPLLVNGDINSKADLLNALKQSKADGVMIGRAAIGKPWLLRDFQNHFKGKPEQNKISELAKKHFELMLSTYGKEMGVRMSRKHLRAYFPNADKDIMGLLLRENEPQKVIKLINIAEREGWANYACL